LLTCGAALAQPASPAPVDPVTLPGADDAITVPGQIDRPVVIPQGDPRPMAERRRHRRAWDRCVMKAQNRHSDDVGSGVSPVRDSPEQVCSAKLGMASRESIPDSLR
jgi:hypothetical protein